MTTPSDALVAVVDALRRNPSLGLPGYAGPYFSCVEVLDDVLLHHLQGIAWVPLPPDGGVVGHTSMRNELQYVLKSAVHNSALQSITYLGELALPWDDLVPAGWQRGRLLLNATAFPPCMLLVNEPSLGDPEAERRERHARLRRVYSMPRSPQTAAVFPGHIAAERATADAGDVAGAVTDTLRCLADALPFLRNSCWEQPFTGVLAFALLRLCTFLEREEPRSRLDYGAAHVEDQRIASSSYWQSIIAVADCCGYNGVPFLTYRLPAIPTGLVAPAVETSIALARVVVQQLELEDDDFVTTVWPLGSCRCDCPMCAAVWIPYASRWGHGALRREWVRTVVTVARDDAGLNAGLLRSFGGSDEAAVCARLCIASEEDGGPSHVVACEYATLVALFL